GAEDERGDALLEDKRQKGVERGVLRPDVQQATDLARVAARPRGGLVDDRVAALQVTRPQIGHARQPAVGLLSGKPEHPGLVRAEPDADVVSWLGAPLTASDRVVGTVGEHAAAGGRVPGGADNVHGL